LLSYHGRIYLRNGNIFDGDIHFSSRGVVEVYILNGKLEFDPLRIDRVVFIERPEKIDEGFLESLKKRKDLFVEEDTEFDELIRRVAKEEGVDPLLVKAIMKVESDFNIYAVSRKGARGLMQLMPHTARKLGVGDIYDPEENLRGGITYLKKMLEKFKGDLILALAAYNAGPLAVEKYKNIPPYQETRRYVRKVLEYYRRYKRKRISLKIFMDENGSIIFSFKNLKGFKDLLSE
ncbi:MAG: hypothetical protein DRI36_01625, partial [Caldiserica bacterium]